MASSKLPAGALLTNSTFKRILGTPGVSEPILSELVSAWRAARAPAGTPAADVALDTTLCDSAVFRGAARNFGGLVVDVRARNSEEHFVIEVQHRPEVLFPHRAVLYGAAEVLAQHATKSATRATASKIAAAAADAAAEAKLAAANAPASDDFGAAAETAALKAADSAALFKLADLAMENHLLLPVHVLAFCDYDFQGTVRRRAGDSGRSSLSIASRLWRTSAAFERDPTRALHIYGLLPDAPAMQQLQQSGSAALNSELAARLSFVFALLPHAPRLEDLNDRTPPLLRWASLVAHAEPNNVGAVPHAIRSAGVERLLQSLATSAELVEDERREALEADRHFIKGEAEGEARGEARGKAIGEARGEARGKAIGEATTLRKVGITSAAEHLAKFGTHLSPEVAEELARLA